VGYYSEKLSGKRLRECDEIGAPPEIVEVDGSSVFCLLTVG
jgi:hypothetical protein